MVNNKEVCEPANSQYYKASDTKSLGADAKIIIALLKQQPLKRVEICQRANINESTFSRYKRLLVNQKIIKESNQGFSLWFYIESPTLWDTMYSALQKEGGNLTRVKLERLLKDRKAYGAHLDDDYGEHISIEGVIIFKGASKLEQALCSCLPNNFSFYGINTSGGYFVTTELVKKGDRLTFKDRIVEADCVSQFFDVETLSFSLVFLKRPDN